MDQINNQNCASPWILCPSQRLPGKFYYFNVVTGEKAWSADDIINNKATKSTNMFHRSPDPEKYNTSMDHNISITSFQTPTIPQTFPFYNNIPTMPNVWPNTQPIILQALPVTSNSSLNLFNSVNQVPQIENDSEIKSLKLTSHTNIPLSKRFDRSSIKNDDFKELDSKKPKKRLCSMSFNMDINAKVKKEIDDIKDIDKNETKNCTYTNAKAKINSKPSVVINLPKYDLRHVISAKRKCAMIPKNYNVETKNLIKHSLPNTKIIINQDIEVIFYKLKNIFKKINLKCENMDTKQWYCIVDLKMLLQEYFYIIKVMNRDKKCHVVIMQDDKEKLLSICKGEAQSNHCRTSRSIMRGISMNKQFVVFNQKPIFEENILIDCWKQFIYNQKYAVILSNDYTIQQNHIRLTIEEFKELTSIKNIPIINFSNKNNTTKEENYIHKENSIITISSTSIKSKKENNICISVNNTNKKTFRNTMTSPIIFDNSENDIYHLHNDTPLSPSKMIKSERDDDPFNWESDIDERIINFDDNINFNDKRNRFLTKKDDWICCYVQCMEDVIQKLLQVIHPIVYKNLLPALCLKESIKYIKCLYNNMIIKKSADYLLTLLQSNCENYGKFKSDIEANDFINIISSSIQLIEYLEKEHEHFEDLKLAADKLKLLLSKFDKTDSESNLSFDTSLQDNIKFYDIDIQKANKQSLEILQNSRKFYINHWQEISENNTTSNENDIQNKVESGKVLRTSGRDLKNIKIHQTKNITMSKDEHNNLQIVNQRKNTLNKNDCKGNIDKQFYNKVRNKNEELLNNKPKHIINIHKNDHNNSEINPKTLEKYGFQNKKIKTKTNLERKKCENIPETSYYNANNKNDIYHNNNDNNQSDNKRKLCDQSIIIHENIPFYHSYDNYNNKNYQNDNNECGNDNIMILDVINDIFSSKDSGISSDEINHAYPTIISFFSSLKKAFMKIYSFVKTSTKDIKRGFRNKRKTVIKLEANRQHVFIKEIINKLKSIIQRESSKSVNTFKELIKRSGVKSTDIRLSRYSQIIEKCLEQAEILESSLKNLISILNNKIIIPFDIPKIKYFNIFEN